MTLFEGGETTCMSANKPLSADDEPAAGAKEKAIEEIVRNADLKKFDLELEEADGPDGQTEWRV
jgi:hypothetical protein